MFRTIFFLYFYLQYSIFKKCDFFHVAILCALILQYVYLNTLIEWMNECCNTVQHGNNTTAMLAIVILYKYSIPSLTSKTRRKFQKWGKNLYLLRIVFYPGPAFCDFFFLGGGELFLRFVPPHPYLWYSTHADHLTLFDTDEQLFTRRAFTRYLRYRQENSCYL